MKGAIFYSSRYGSTAQYAKWISEATDVPLYDIKNSHIDPSGYDFLVLGFPVIYHKLYQHKWVNRHLKNIAKKPIIVFTVSGAMEGVKLDGWIENSLPQSVITRMKHVALGGRQNPKELNLFDRVMLIIGGLTNRDRAAAKDEIKGFDFMDKSSIQPVVKLVNEFQDT